jgi:transcriptional regulator GlxA family with amidase domain
MKIAFVVYNGMTALDFAGMYDPLTRLRTMGFLPDLVYDVCARTDPVTTHEGLRIIPDAGRVCRELAEYDYILVPGGNSVESLMQDTAFLNWITVDTKRTVIAAVCGGVLLLGAAGLLRTRRATTHPGLREVLKRFAGEVSDSRVVKDGNIVTAGGVTASIDLGLYLCERIAGLQVRERIQEQMDYRIYSVA